ncbi:hypothetical protein SAMN04490239_5362 [Rhodococcus koreensis]|uniref:Uncharacterized protein n=1 Tax=Rhodococcus koreensis TaxID=99653 RepID=A0A1H4V640_9NOCA|nr:hypothetical protein SAMN04490239_5362 [Rhodococcus koreensis]
MNGLASEYVRYVPRFAQCWEHPSVTPCGRRKSHMWLARHAEVVWDSGSNLERSS